MPDEQRPAEPIDARPRAPGGLLRQLWHEIPNDHVFTIAASLAYYGIFGVLPALAGAAMLWAMAGDLGALQQSAQSGSDVGVLPAQAAAFVQRFLAGVPAAMRGGVGVGLNLLLVLFTTWRSAQTLLIALDIAYDVENRRGLLGQVLASIAIGTGGMAFLVATLVVLALPSALAGAPGLAALAFWARWPALALVLCCGLALLFRYAPRRAAPRWGSVVAGAATATALWVAASIGVSLYVRLVGDFGRLYGPLSGIAVALLWFWAGSSAILIGAEVDDVLSARSSRVARAPLRHRLRHYAGRG